MVNQRQKDRKKRYKEAGRVAAERAAAESLEVGNWQAASNNPDLLAESAQSSETPQPVEASTTQLAQERMAEGNTNEDEQEQQLRDETTTTPSEPKETPEAPEPPTSPQTAEANPSSEEPGQMSEGATQGEPPAATATDPTGTHTATKGIPSSDESGQLSETVTQGESPGETEAPKPPKDTKAERRAKSLAAIEALIQPEVSRLDSLESCQRELAEVRDERDDLTRTIKSLNERINSQTKLLSQIENESYEREYAEQAIDKENKSVKTAWRAALRVQTERNDTLQRHLKEWTEERDGQDEERRKLKQFAQSFQTSINHKDAEIKALDADNERLRAELDKKNQQIADDLVDAISTTQARYRPVEEKLENLKVRYKSLEEKTQEYLGFEIAARQQANEYEKRIEDLVRETKDQKRDLQKHQAHHKHETNDTEMTKAVIDTQTQPGIPTTETDLNATGQIDVMEELKTPESSTENVTEAEPSQATGTAVDAPTPTANTAADAIVKTQAGPVHHNLLYGLLILGLVLLIAIAAFALYHGLQAAAERQMWLAANDTSRRAVIYYRAMAEKGHRVPWMTTQGINRMRFGYGGPGLRPSRVEW